MLPLSRFTPKFISFPKRYRRNCVSFPAAATLGPCCREHLSCFFTVTTMGVASMGNLKPHFGDFGGQETHSKSWCRTCRLGFIECRGRCVKRRRTFKLVIIASGRDFGINVTGCDERQVSPLTFCYVLFYSNFPSFFLWVYTDVPLLNCNVLRCRVCIYLSVSVLYHSPRFV